jgi:hypothetical protein
MRRRPRVTSHPIDGSSSNDVDGSLLRDSNHTRAPLAGSRQIKPLNQHIKPTYQHIKPHSFLQTTF